MNGVKTTTDLKYNNKLKVDAIYRNLLELQEVTAEVKKIIDELYCVIQLTILNADFTQFNNTTLKEYDILKQK